MYHPAIQMSFVLIVKDRVKELQHEGQMGARTNIGSDRNDRDDNIGILFMFVPWFGFQGRAQ